MMIKAVTGNLRQMASSPHTSIPGIVALGCTVGRIWFPQYKDQFQETATAFLSWAALFAAQIQRPAPPEEEEEEQGGQQALPPGPGGPGGIGVNPNPPEK